VREASRGCKVHHSEGLRASVLSLRKRRNSVALLRDIEGYIVIADPATRSQTGRPSRYHASRSKLTVEARTAIREASATGRSLRELAAQYRVSHQTIANAINGNAAA
jgi:hypothetical protein